MMAGHTGTDTFLAPAVFWLVDTSKSSFILEHQTIFLTAVDNFQFFYFGVIFLRPRFLLRWPFGDACCEALLCAIYGGAAQNKSVHC